MEENILKIRQIGDPILKQKCRKIDINKMKKCEKDFIKCLKTTFKDYGGFGLAAPQVGKSYRIFVIKVDIAECKYENAENVNLTVMINPVITNLSLDTNVEYEGCHSVPQIRGTVRRSTSLDLEYYDENLTKHNITCKGYTARLIQHEYDHLDGITFTQKLEDINSLSTVENLKKFNMR